MSRTSNPEFLVLNEERFEELMNAGIYPHTTTAEDRYINDESVDYRVYSGLSGLLESGEIYSLLDVGSSSAEALDSLVERLEEETGAELQAYALDVDGEMMKRCKDKGESSPVLGAGQKLPFKDNSMDLVVSSQLYLRDDSMEKVITEINRVMKQEGHAVLSSGYVLDDSEDYRGLHHGEINPEIF